ncbi:hypothetical protein KAJ89_01240 [Candidatus Parcubacteria bacterium]|nr:hypothetical protein [Candidatus Parcubacteria bacterium]
MAERTKDDLEVDFRNCCTQLSEEQSGINPDKQRIQKLRKLRDWIAKGINILRNPKRSKANFADVGR